MAIDRRTRARRVAAMAALVALTASGLSASRAAPSRNDLDSAEARLRALERDFELAVERYNLVHERLDDLRAEIAAKELVVRTVEDRMRTRQDAAVALARRLYKGGATAPIEAVLSSDSIAEVESNLAYLKSSEQAQARVFERLDADRSQLTAQLEALDEARAEAASAEARMAEMREEIEAKLAEQKDEIAELNRQLEAARERRARARAEARAASTAAASREDASNPGGGSGGGGSAPTPAAPAAPAPAPSGSARIAVETALAQVGKPYKWGASGPDSFDCSGLTMYAWARAGVSLPHNSGAQYAATRRVSRGDWQPGDLLFHGSPIHHVGMYIGGGRMVEAPYTGASVRVVSAYRSDYVGAGRPGV